MAASASPQSPAGELLHIVGTFWWLWVLLGAAALIKLAVQLAGQRRLARSGIYDIDAMDGREFEEYLATLFQRLGYSVEVTRLRGDYGADLVVERDGVRTAVQAKCWRKRVGLKAVQEVEASKAVYDCHAALVVTNSGYTDQARRLAHANGVQLWDREVLVGKLLGAPTAPAPPALAGGRSPDRCATCGVAVSSKVLEYCREHSERFGGRVYCFKHQRAVPPPASAPA